MFSSSGPTQSVYELIVARIPPDGSPGLTDEPRGTASWAYGHTVRSARVLELVEAARDPARFEKANQELCAFLAGYGLNTPCARRTQAAARNFKS